MNRVSYEVWKIGEEFKFRLEGQVKAVPLTMHRRRELTKLLTKWDEEERPTADPEEQGDGS